MKNKIQTKKEFIKKIHEAVDKRSKEKCGFTLKEAMEELDKISGGL